MMTLGGARFLTVQTHGRPSSLESSAKRYSFHSIPFRAISLVEIVPPNADLRWSQRSCWLFSVEYVLNMSRVSEVHAREPDVVSWRMMTFHNRHEALSPFLIA